MAMLPFCGYHMGDYFAHWIRVGERGGDKMPRIYYVNWFRKGADGKFLWPGYGENSRVLAWIFDRCDGAAEAMETPIGRLPASSALDMQGLEVTPANLQELLHVDVEGWKAEIPSIRKHFEKFGAKLPKELVQELDELEKRLNS
jgi:phosphoenolpyruvate carboxykinase (GTP)